MHVLRQSIQFPIQLFGSTSPLGSDVPFEIDTHLTSIDTGRIDAKYMQDKFDKWLKCLDQRGVSAAETQAALDELRVSFARQPREDQDVAQVITQVELVKSWLEGANEGRVASANVDGARLTLGNNRVARDSFGRVGGTHVDERRKTAAVKVVKDMRMNGSIVSLCAGPFFERKGI